MLSVEYFLVFISVFFSGASLSQVHQTPAEMYKSPGETAKLSCVHSILNYNQILWYKQSKTGQLQLLGYMLANSAFPEAGVSVKMGGSADTNETSTLTIEQLSLNRSAVYFCVASLHSAIYHCSAAQKPPRHTFYHVYNPVHTPLHLYLKQSFFLEVKVGGSFCGEKQYLL